MKKNRILLLFLLVLLVFSGIGGKLLFDRYLPAAGTLIPRNAVFLDLTGRKLSAEAFDALRQKLPDCEILWEVPFQGQRIPSDSERLTISSLTEEDLALLDYFPELAFVDAAGCTDYEELLQLQARYPEVALSYEVTLGGKCYGNRIDALELSDADMQELEAALPHLRSLKKLQLTGALPDYDRVKALQAAFPGVQIGWELEFMGNRLSSETTALDLSGKDLDRETLESLLPWLPGLETIDLRRCGLSPGELMALADAFPDCFFLFDMTIGPFTVSTDAVELDISGYEISSPEEIETLLPYFPYLQTVIMSHCGLSDETMDQLNRRHETIRFIWSVLIKDVYIRTDAKWFYPFKYYRDMVVSNQELYPLRYCTDMEAIDIGHMTTVTDCEWAAFMPELKYLVIVETAITDLSPLSGLKKLVFLEIFTTNITDYTPLLGCTALEDLNLGKTYGDPAVIAQMTWLKNLWWMGVQGTYGQPYSNAHILLPEALPNTNMRFLMDTPNVNNGWRQLENYYKMRDLMEVFYLT